jgi:hypothetical protein
MRTIILMGLMVASCLPKQPFGEEPTCTVSSMQCLDDKVLICTSHYTWIEVQDCSAMVPPWHCGFVFSAGVYSCLPPNVDAGVKR